MQDTNEKGYAATILGRLSRTMDRHISETEKSLIPISEATNIIKGLCLAKEEIDNLCAYLLLEQDYEAEEVEDNEQ